MKNRKVNCCSSSTGLKQCSYIKGNFTVNAMKYTKDHCIHMQFLIKQKGKMKTSGLLVLKQPNTTEKILQSTTILQGGKTCQCLKTQYFMGKAYRFVYMYLNLSLLRNYESFTHIYPTYRHRRFHIIYCKAQNRHFKSESIH